ncbi:PAS-domain containing protein [Phreatobacter stygius]|uniref:EAL domain-containing protein n=1 Tax=Phreatobacter stygius TaxID=1940610 RepID=A0A4D7BB69_9HYPH|nr:PAS-domain containing protein [Phreatobacter stygius]QCI66696.1 EAL domain-containing protein [Phreatobacter stygius]
MTDQMMEACDDGPGKSGRDRQESLLALHETALDAITHGLCVFDAAYRIALHNRRFLELFGLAAAVVRPGLAMRDLLKHSADRGNFVGVAFDAVWQARSQRLARAEPFDDCQALADGRIIAISYRPTTDGGWVATYADVTAHHRLEQAYRLQVMRFEQALGNMAHGLAMYGPDERLIVCNRHYIEHFDLDPAVVQPGVSLYDVLQHFIDRGTYVGMTGQELYDESHRRLTEVGRCDFVRPLADGRYLSIRNRPTAGGGWVITSEDITDREHAAEELREQHRRFDAALNNMSQGLCMFDGQHRLTVCNEQYISMFRADPAVVKPGVSLRGVFEHGVAIGIYPGATAEELVERRMAAMADRVTKTYDQKMADGRRIEITICPLPDGGWIGTFEDVTDLRQVEAERAMAIAEVQEQNLLLDATLDSMAQGLCVFDPDLRVVVRNKRYLEFYGLDPEACKPGTPLIDLMRLSVARGIHLQGYDADAVMADFKARLLDKGEPMLTRRLADGRVVAVRSRPMANGGWVTTFEDITERERAAEELSEQYRRFDAALNNMAHGLCMLDERLSLIVCNQRYLDMYRLSPDVVRPGVSMRKIVEHSVAIGNYQDMSADDLLKGYFERLRAGNYVSHRQLADGRIFKVVYEPMEHGGWVATHEDVTERHKAEQHIAHMAHHDALTDLPNRVLFRDKMAEGLTDVEHGGDPLAVFCLDLDHFKSVNDTLGHPVGDRLLRAVSERLMLAVGPQGTIARLGGDEFAILMRTARPQDSEALARRLVALMAEPFVIDGQVINTGSSIGIAVAPQDGTAADHLMKCADLALYRAKSEGRGMFRFFEPDMSARIQARRELELDLRQALGAGEFHLVFQPQVRAATEVLTGFETLLRWTHPARGAVSPAEFIPLAEETGLILPIGEWVLRGACMEAARWPDPIKVAVNLSPVQFKNRSLVAMVVNALAASGLPPHRLELEITEAVLLQKDDVTIAMLHELRALGIRISMDDFGVGYSSLSYLRSFPFDKIKIDRSFIADLDRNKDNAAIVRAMADLGTSLRIETTAEGVETPEQLAIVRACGCTEIQGYLISPPKPAADALDLIARLYRKAVAA